MALSSGRGLGQVSGRRRDQFAEREEGEGWHEAFRNSVPAVRSVIDLPLFNPRNTLDMRGYRGA